MGSPTKLHIYKDSGPPKGSTDYTTLVLIHGYVWHSHIFIKLVPLAYQHNARIVLVNRRDYPGAAPYTAEEREQLQIAAAEGKSNPTPARERLQQFMKERAREVYDLLVNLVTDNDIPLARPEANSGGIVIGGWSFATSLMIALLANVSTFPVDKVNLESYVRRVILYDPPHLVLGLSPPPKALYNPIRDPSIAPEKVTDAFSYWVSGYFQHGDSVDTFEMTPLAFPSPVMSRLTADELETFMCREPGYPKRGADSLFVTGSTQSGLLAVVREQALYFRSRSQDGNSNGSSEWSAVEVRHLWCDRSPWEMSWGAWKMMEELDEAKRTGKPIRNVSMLRLRGANHFVHWDEPARALQALLEKAPETVEHRVAHL